MLSEQLKQCGVVGAGGAGFPAYVKAKSQAEYVLANGAECEPLIHKDVELMMHFPEEIVSGMKLMMQSTNAREGKFGIKEKHREAIDLLAPHLKKNNIEFSLLGDFYPSGDEYELVYSATGRLIPPAGLPLHVGCVVNNVETLFNIHFAAQNIPVTEKFVSIAGAVNSPTSLRVPIGISFRELIEAAGGATVHDFGIFVGGLMMGKLSFDLDDVVTKTTAGLIILPLDHFLVSRKSQTKETMARIGKSACDQCSYCTEFCPRYLLGYDVQPHKVMRSLGFSAMGTEHWSQWADLCCSCGLCTLYACPEDLFPKEACDDGKKEMRAQGIKFVQQKEVRVHPMKEMRRVPQSQLRKRLNVEDRDTPFNPVRLHPSSVKIKLSQHAGTPASPIVSAGDRVEKGMLIAQVSEEHLGVNIHASVAGKVSSITNTFIEIEC
ncbi:MAG: 4Fe-4S dicluster domain-containing protein [Bacteroidota bacterium]|jgi:Na+-translocating ferredoxin:NAD+ oxidoreductase RnfC subunit